MMSLHLNLLSPTKKAKLKQLVHYLMIKEILELVLLTVTILGITHVLGWLVLTSFLSELAASTTTINRDNTHHNQEILIVNSQIHTLQQASVDFVPLSPHLHEIISTLPADVRLTSVELSRPNQTLIISGIARTRIALLNYQQILEKIPWIGELDIPPSQLFQKDNVGFEIHAPITGLPKLSTNGQPPKRRPVTPSPLE
jgi:Tfp pilus assembly protein PilN